jgi:hypothetical protein
MVQEVIELLPDEPDRGWAVLRDDECAGDRIALSEHLRFRVAPKRGCARRDHRDRIGPLARPRHFELEGVGVGFDFAIAPGGDALG